MTRSRSALSSSARSSETVSSSVVSSSPVRKCRAICVSSAGTSTTAATSRPTRPCFTLRSRLLRTTERGAHARAGQPAAAGRVRRACSTASSGTWRCCRRRRRAGSPSSAGAPGRAACACSPRATGGRRCRARWPTSNPDLIASSEGGSNQILVRHPGRVIEHRRLTLARRPERRRMQWARLETAGAAGACAWRTCTPRPGCRRKAAREVLARRRGRAVDWSGPDPLVFGGDLNLRPARDPEPVRDAARALRARRADAPRDAIDHLLVRGLDRGRAPAAAGRRASASCPSRTGCDPALRPRARRRGVRAIVRRSHGDTREGVMAQSSSGSRKTTREASRAKRSRRKAKPKAASSSAPQDAPRARPPRKQGRQGDARAARRRRRPPAAREDRGQRRAAAPGSRPRPSPSCATRCART